MSDNKKTMMFGADWCGDCIRAKQVFADMGVDYDYIDLVKDESAATVAREISGRTNIPVIVYPDGSFQVEPVNAEITARVEALSLGGTPE